MIALNIGIIVAPNINFQLKAGEKTNLKEFSESYTEYKMPDNFQRVVVGFPSDTDTRVEGIAFYDKWG